MATNGDKSSKTFDISHPGKAMPNATSRPTIVGHRAIMKDPMVVAAAKSDDDEPAEKVLQIHPSGRKITPLMDDDKQIVAVVDAPNKKAAPVEGVATTGLNEDVPADKITVAEAKLESEKSESEPEPEKVAAPLAATVAAPEATPATETASDDAESTDAPATKVDEEKLAEKKLEEDIAKQEAIEKLVNDKTYIVPIGEKKRRRSMVYALIWVIVFLLVGVAAADVLIDSGTIKTTIKPPISIFKVK